jgi:glucan phosphoethanolaminetransferase (alkaline phosphatase superfamily)
MKNKLGNEVSPVKIGFFIAFVVVLLFGLISVFIIHSHLLAFITIPLFFILFIISVVLQYRDVKSGRFQKNMDKLWENTKEKYGRK